MPIPSSTEILGFAQAGGALVQSQVDYAADAERTLGNQPGIARPDFVNKTLRQCAAMSAGLAQYLANRQTIDVTDSLTASQIAGMLAAATVPEGIIIRNSAPAAHALAAWEKVDLDFAIENFNGWFSTITNRYTPALAGWYIVNAQVAVSADAASPIAARAAIYFNGALHNAGATVEGAGVFTDTLVAEVSDAIYLNGTTDYIELWSYVDGTGTGGVEATAEKWCELRTFYLRA
jgi:hypothetical protein